MMIEQLKQTVAEAIEEATNADTNIVQMVAAAIHSALSSHDLAQGYGRQFNYEQAAMSALAAASEVIVQRLSKCTAISKDQTKVVIVKAPCLCKDRTDGYTFLVHTLFKKADLPEPTVVILPMEPDMKIEALSDDDLAMLGLQRLVRN